MMEKVVWRDDAGVDEDAGNDGVQESRILTDERTGSPYDFTDLKLRMKERIEAPTASATTSRFATNSPTSGRKVTPSPSRS